MDLQLTSNLTCPECGHTSAQVMPTDACQWFYDCPHCAVVLKPMPGDCCVFCSYGDVSCPPIQEGSGCCAGSDLSRETGTATSRRVDC